MRSRPELQNILEKLLGSEEVYFQAPLSKMFKYPAIVYSLDNVDTRFASNSPYSHDRRWQITLIETNPDSDIMWRVLTLPKCSMSNRFVRDRLYHTIFNLYF